MDTTRTYKAIRTWGEMVKFSHSIFALPFALIAAFLAARGNTTGLPYLSQLLLIIVCMIAARSFAMTFNRIVDVGIDSRNPRTASRPLVTRQISKKEAWTFLFISAIGFVLACAGFYFVHENAWPILLSIPTLGFLAMYSYTKRFTPLAHFWLGAGIAFAPTAAWIAIDPATVGLPVICLTGAVLFWIAGFDIIYACQDIEADRREGLFSIPARLGIAKSLLLSRGCHALTLLLLVAFGRLAGLGWLYWIGVATTACLLAAEHSVVKPGDLSKVNLAFFTINGCISVLLAVVTITDIIVI